MRFDRARRPIFPRSLRPRIFALCCVSACLPLFALAIWQAARDAMDWSTLGIVLGATLIGIAFILLAIDSLLIMVRSATEAIASTNRRQLSAIRAVRRNEMFGELIAGIDRVAEAARARVVSLDSAAYRDPLTGLWNRRGFLSQTAVAGEGAVALLDLDQFKAINEQYGRDAGDQVLRDFAGFLSRVLRSGDIVARWGGVSFAVFFPATTEHEAGVILHRLTRRLAAGAVEGPDTIPVSFSGGVVDLEGDPFDQAVTRASEALSAAKRNGRDQVRVGRKHLRAV
ncbi:GGDEF domain-containing protein [Sphingomonas sp. BT-65]|uniref:GGDEF domain-containing protein n=1 Tax=Sphingomonas sp. BT-65 TaxID=2989821 RepID=UPI0022355A8C|nr:GGDEF domain-containing protein [Sphingomonas sp. BT-65]MCW4460444.1 GGDEF domain-containing protein [Sphingomonas sp. BT-65]